jgi:uncharacterized protein YsxB (DUF464 family)
LITVTFNNLSYDEELRLPDTDDRIVSITIEGHAITGEMPGGDVDGKKVATARGENIICAAVSFSGLNLVRSLTIISGTRPDYSIENGIMRLSLAAGSLDDKNKLIVKVLLESFIIGMLDLERKYREFISVIIDNNRSKRQ